MISRHVIPLLPGRLLVSHYLLASYCYYWENCSPMTDDAYDLLCVRLLKEFDDIEHIHKHLVEKGALTAGTCLLPRDEYPSRVIYGWRDYISPALNGVVERELMERYGKSQRTRVTRVSRTPRKPEPEPVTTRVRRVRMATTAQQPEPTRKRRTVRPARSE